MASKAAKAPKTWTCQRKIDGEKCGHINPARKQLCEECKGRKAKKKPPAHRRVLDVFPRHCWDIFFGDHCGICDREATPDAPLVRDHDHRVVPGEQGGGMRGLLCFLCNKNMPYWVTIEWLEQTTQYVRDAAGIRGS